MSSQWRKQSVVAPKGNQTPIITVNDYVAYKDNVLKLNVLCGICNNVDAYIRRTGNPNRPNGKQHTPFQPDEDEKNEFNLLCPMIFATESIAVTIAVMAKDTPSTACSFEEFKAALKTMEGWLGKEWKSIPTQHSAILLAMMHTTWRTAIFNVVEEAELPLFKAPIGAIADGSADTWLQEYDLSCEKVQAQGLEKFALAAKCLLLQIEGKVQFADRSNWPCVTAGTPSSTGNKVAEGKGDGMKVFQNEKRIYTVKFCDALSLEAYEYEDLSKVRLSKCDLSKDELADLIKRQDAEQ
jgi:hypothetical protein